MATFQQYHDSNKHIYEIYKAVAFDLIRQGRKRIGSKFIFERIRYDLPYFQSEGIYKIDNNQASMYARKFVLEHPQFGHLFKFKQLKGVMLM